MSVIGGLKNLEGSEATDRVAAAVFAAGRPIGLAAIVAASGVPERTAATSLGKLRDARILRPVEGGTRRAWEVDPTHRLTDIHRAALARSVRPRPLADTLRPILVAAPLVVHAALVGTGRERRLVCGLSDLASFDWYEVRAVLDEAAEAAGAELDIVTVEADGVAAAVRGATGVTTLK